MAVTTTTELGGLFNTIYEDALLVAREQVIMTNLVSNFSAKGWMGRTFKVRPSISAVAVGETEDFAAPTTFGVSALGTLTPGEIMAQVVLTDRDIDTDPDDARTQAVTELGNSIAAKIDTDLLADFSLLTDKGPGANNSASIGKFAVCVSVLRNAKAANPIQIVLHPYAWHDIWVELGQPASQKALLGELANKALQDFFVGNWLMADWWVSANIAVDTNSDVINGVFNPQALAFDSRKAPKLEPERDASKRAWELNFSAGYAHGLGRRPAFGVAYICDATEPS